MTTPAEASCRIMARIGERDGSARPEWRARATVWGVMGSEPKCTMYDVRCTNVPYVRGAPKRLRALARRLGRCWRSEAERCVRTEGSDGHVVGPSCVLSLPPTREHWCGGGDSVRSEPSGVSGPCVGVRRAGMGVALEAPPSFDPSAIITDCLRGVSAAKRGEPATRS